MRPESDAQALKKLMAADVIWLGQFGEAIWSNVLASSGWHYISLSKIVEGGAPLARSQHGNIILPDFDAMNGMFKKAAFVEAKAKSQSIIYRNKKQERHGINERNYRHYKEIAEMQQKPCAIAIVELMRDGGEWSGSLLIETLSNLGEPSSEFPETPPKVYWNRKLFSDLDSFSATELFDLAAGRMKRSYGYELEHILCPKLQRGLFATA